MSLRQTVVCVSLLAVLLCGRVEAASRQREVADWDVDRAIAEAKRFLYARQRSDGHWPYYAGGVGPIGGATAWTMFALLEAGESHQDQRIRKGLEALGKIKTGHLYVIATRVMVLGQIVASDKDSPHRAKLMEDVKWLLRGFPRARGAWGYGGPEIMGDNSCSQFALLALWEAQRAGIDVPTHLMRMVEATWLRRQFADGGWTYSGQTNVKTPATLSMTTAALASLYICQDVLSTTCAKYRHQKSRNSGWAFLGARLKDDYIDDGYLAFCVQRIGMTSGRKFISDMDWFAAGAGKLAEPNPKGRSFRGKWGPVVQAGFELIFLSRGRIPLTFNKVRHGAGDSWNFHGRDVARFTEFMRRNFEQRMRWQIVKIDEDVKLLLDAPILLISGTGALNLTPQQWSKLREYTLRGGTILFVTTHQSKAFLDSAKEGLRSLYADWAARAGGNYELVRLGDEHDIYSIHNKIPKGGTTAPMWGLSDGTRLLAVVSQRDLACGWQKCSHPSSRVDLDLGVNFFVYATGDNPLRTRMRPVFVGSSSKAKFTTRIAWVKHDGNWCTQPYALDVLSGKLIAENRLGLTVTMGAPLESKQLEGHQLAWMTGTGRFKLSDAQIAGLREYLDDGGTLFVNAVGGSGAFRKSARTMLDKLFAGRDVSTGNVSSGSALMTGVCGDFRGPRIESLQRTKTWRQAMPKQPAPLRVYSEGGRVTVIYAMFGVHDTMDGHTSCKAMSYLPASARDIACNVVLYASIPKPKRPSTTSAPAAPRPTN